MFRTTTIQKIYPAIDTFDHYFSKHYVSPSDIKCFRMIVEDVIVAYKEKCGCDKFAYSLTNKRRKVAVTLAFKGESYAVFEDKYNILIRNMMTNISGKCSWEYKKGKNFVRIEFDTPRSLAQSLLYLGKFIKEEKVRVTEACVLQMIGIAICVIIPILTAKLISNFTLGNIAAIIITIAVLFDGVDISELDKDTIRGNISVVSQSPYVFNMSIKENLRLIKPDLTDEEMVSLCRDACIHDEILNFPQGYDTIVGEGGTMLSGGQRQRLALARGMLKNNRIILLDEATSALDNVTQAHIQETINRVKHKKTVIIVAHRLSTIKVCDRIFYFSDGRVLAQGSHEQMMETCPEYRELYMSE